MRFQEVYKEFAQKKYYVFSFENMCAFYPSEKQDNLKQYLSRWMKAGWIAPLKKGLYELTYPQDKHFQIYISPTKFIPLHTFHLRRHSRIIVLFQKFRWQLFRCLPNLLDVFITFMDFLSTARSNPKPFADIILKNTAA